MLCAYSPQLVNRGDPESFAVRAVVRDKIAGKKVKLEIYTEFRAAKLPPRGKKP
jgi:hypothetical protein